MSSTDWKQRLLQAAQPGIYTAAALALTIGCINPVDPASAADSIEVMVTQASLSDASADPAGSGAAQSPAPVEGEPGPTEALPPDPPAVLPLAELVALAVAHNPGLKAMNWQALAWWEQSESVAGYGGLRAEASITSFTTNSPLGVFGTKLSQGRVTQADFDPATLNDPDWPGTVEYKLKLMYPLFDSGRVQLLSDALALNSNAIDLDALGAEHQLTLKVIEAYFNHALLTSQLEVLNDAAATTAELLRMINSLYTEGLVIGSDIAAAEVEAANLADELNQARVNRELIETTLGILTGTDGMAFTSVVPGVNGLSALTDLENATEVALENRPDLLAMGKRLGAALYMLDEAIRQQNPTIGVFAEAKHTSPNLFDNGHGEGTIGAQIMFDLDTGGVISNTIEQRRAELQAAQWMYDQLTDQAQMEIAAALARLEITRQSMDTFAAQSKRSAENQRVVTNRYREGLTNFLDVRLAITTHKECQLREVKSRNDYLLAWLELLAATGQIGTAADPFLGCVCQPEDNATAVNSEKTALSSAAVEASPEERNEN